MNAGENKSSNADFPSVGPEIGAQTPASKIFYLEAIREHVPVFEREFRISQDATIAHSTTSDIVRSLVSSGKTLEIEGALKYQACDHRVCYPPACVTVTWRVQVLPLDLKRSPEDIRHK